MIRAGVRPGDRQAKARGDVVASVTDLLLGQGVKARDLGAAEAAFASYLGCLESLQPKVQKELAASEDALARQAGREAAAACNRALARYLYKKNNDRRDPTLPQGVAGYQEEDFARALKLASAGADEQVTFHNYVFYSYIEVLAFRRWPVGNHYVVRSGVPRRLLLRQPPGLAAKLLWTLAGGRGNHPYFELHYNPHRLRLFNPEGWRCVFELTAGLMGVFGDIKGVFGVSWFFDPKLASLSPELGFLRRQVEEVGGRFFVADTTKDHIENALKMSRARRAAYKAGRYRPACYLALVPRAALLRHFRLG